MVNNKRVALYCRVAREDDEIIKMQEVMLRQFAGENDFTNISTYADNGFHGLNFNRPAFKRLNEDISAGLIGTVIVKDISRIGRNYIDITDWIDTIEAKGVTFKSVIDDYNFLKGINKMMLQSFNDYCAKRRTRKEKLFTRL